MEIPSLPTDNLYKFYALAGTYIAIFFLSATIYLFYIIEIKTLELDNNRSKLTTLTKINTEYFKKESLYITNLNDTISEKNEYLKNRYKKSFSDKYYEDYKEYIKEKREIYEMIFREELKKKEYMDSVQLKLQENAERVDELIKIIDFSKPIAIVSTIFTFIGFFLAFWGFKSWKKLQIDSDNNTRNMLLFYKRRNNYK